MCGAFGHSATQLKRVRIMNVAIGNMRPNEVRPLEGAELKTFLKSIGIKA
jgi:23S rRNA pseudouridine2604 synthase